MELGDIDEIKQINTGLMGAFHQLGLNSSPDVLEPLAHMIYQAMSGEGRYYHTPDHAISLMDGLNPVQRLAALFHDVVYYQVDGGFSAEVWPVIKSYLVIPPTGRAGFKIAMHPAIRFGLPSGGRHIRV
jgi:hypothetical protein